MTLLRFRQSLEHLKRFVDNPDYWLDHHMGRTSITGHVQEALDEIEHRQALVDELVPMLDVIDALATGDDHWAENKITGAMECVFCSVAQDDAQGHDEACLFARAVALPSRRNRK